MKPNSCVKRNSGKSSSTQAILIAAVREALSVALQEDITDKVVTLALQEVSLERIPEEGVNLYDFVMGPLRGTIQTFMTKESSDLVVTRLLGILVPQISKLDGSLADISGVRRLSNLPSADSIPIISSDKTESLFPDDEPTRQRSMKDIVIEPMLRQTITPPSIQSASVLMLTKDPHISMLFAILLGSNINLESYSDMAAFIEALHSDRLINTIVLIDFRADKFPNATLSRILPCLSENYSVVLWGNSDALETQYRVLDRNPPDRWITCSEDVEPEDLTTLIRSAFHRIIA